MASQDAETERGIGDRYAYWSVPSAEELRIGDAPKLLAAYKALVARHVALIKGV